MNTAWASFGRSIVLLLAMGSAVQAAETAFTSATPAFGAFFANERRQTHFQALQDVTLSALGAEGDPAGGDFSWRILNSDALGSFGSTLIEIPITLGDQGLGVYDTPVNVDLTGGNYYYLEFQNDNVFTATIRQDSESESGLPFTTSDGRFFVIDGKANEVSNTLLPGFSVTVAPEPSSPLLSAAALAAIATLALLRRRHGAVPSRSASRD